MAEDQIENQAKAQADPAGVAEMTVALADEMAAVAPAEVIGVDRVRRPLTVDLIVAVAGVRTAILKMAGVYAMLSVVAAGVWGALQGPRFRIDRPIARPEAVRRAGARLEHLRVVNIARYNTNRS